MTAFQNNKQKLFSITVGDNVFITGPGGSGKVI